MWSRIDMRSMHAPNYLNLIVHLCGKISHTKKKVGLCPTWQPATDIEAGLASADCRIDAARDRPSVVPSACGPQAHATSVPFTMPLGQPGSYFGLRQAVYEGATNAGTPSKTLSHSESARRVGADRQRPAWCC